MRISLLLSLLSLALVAPPRQAALDVSTATGSEREEEAATQLRRLVDEWPLGRWIFTDRVVIDQDETPHSHPVLTLNARNLDQDDLQVAAFVHEQFHWFVESDETSRDGAIAEFGALFPEAPDRSGGGARSRYSSWLHLIVCDLEYQAMQALVGDARAREILESYSFYPWVYDLVLNDPRIRAINARHGFLAATAGPSPALRVELASPEQEQAAEAQLRRLLDRYDLGRYTFTSSIRIERFALPHSHPILTLNTKYLGDDDRALSTFVHEQFHWMEEAMPLQREAALAEFAALFPEAPGREGQGASDRESTWLHLIVCDLEFQALTRLLGEPRARETLGRMDHYQWIYTAVLGDPRVREVNLRHGFVAR